MVLYASLDAALASLVPRPSHPSICLYSKWQTLGEKAWVQGYMEFNKLLNVVNVARTRLCLDQ